MGRLRTYTKLNIELEKNNGSGSERKSSHTRGKSGRVYVPKKSCKDHFSLVEPQISAEGIHKLNFDDSCPVDVQFMIEHGRQNVRMNRHGYFEVLYLCSGSAYCHIQD